MLMNSPVSEPVTLGEVDRNVQRLREEFRDGLNNLSVRMDRALDRTVPADVYSADKAAWEYRINDLEKSAEQLGRELDKREAISRGQKNLLYAAFIFPTLLLIINVVLGYVIGLRK